MNVTSIALKLTSLFFSGGILIILFKNIKALKRYGLITIIYILMISILLSFPTLFNLFKLNLGSILLLIMAQAFILVVGILHVVFVPSTLPWYKDQPFSIQIVFLSSVLFMALFFTNLSLSDLQNNPLPLIWYLSLLWFLVPVLLDRTVEELLKMPEKEYKLWYYPENERIDDPTDEELENPIVISFIFRKNKNSRELTTFRAKAPVGMSVGRLFYFFINDYNNRNPEGTISYVDEKHEPCGWVFKKVKSKLLGIKEVIDPDDSVYKNEIKENDLLYCHRIFKNK